MILRALRPIDLSQSRSKRTEIFVIVIGIAFAKGIGKACSLDDLSVA